LKAFLQGPYASGQMSSDLSQANLLPLIQPYPSAPAANVMPEYFTQNPGIVDWLVLSLRSGTDSKTEVASWPVLIKEDGSILSTSGQNVLSLASVPVGDYYVVLEHRNHLAVMSSSKVSLSPSVSLHDFTADVGYEQGDSAQHEIQSGLYAMWSGDITGDGQIRYSGSLNDRVEILDFTGGPGPFDSATGYLSGDIDMNGIVKYSGANNDRVLILNNLSGPTAFDSRSSQVPQ